MHAAIRNISYYLPPRMAGPEDASSSLRSAADLAQRTGVAARRVADPHECSSDLGVIAARQLFEEEKINPHDIDFLLFCTQTPDFSLPASACLIHAELGLPSTAGAFDYNLGCSGYVYGLSLAKGLIETGQAKNVLLITAETHSKLPVCTQTANVYGDGAAATLIEASDDPRLSGGIGPFIFGTDGTAAGHIISNATGFRRATGSTQACSTSGPALRVDNVAVFEVGMRVVPKLVDQILERAGLGREEIQAAVFYQAGKSSLELLRRRTGIPEDKFYVSMKDCGNVSSSNIPIALKRAADEGVLRAHDRVLLVGFGSGLSWAATVVQWAHKPANHPELLTRTTKSLKEQETYAGT